ncbi:MAG TPA: mechanosensitive ion channel domain-containing protein [Opitutaceae bacterium]|nr:mechanosensitive ion channel domain-containing protein [Opitutaceae bacterium]
MEHLDPELLSHLVKSTVIAVIALGLFFGLRGRILLFAQWAGLPRLAFAPVRLLLRYSILAVAVALILGLWGFPMGTLLAFVGTVLGLVAIGFVAVWSVLSNFLCTFVLVLFKPFSVGDELELPADNVKGRVVDLSLIFTTLQTGAGETVMIPNNTYFQRVFKRRAGRHTTGLAEQLRQNEKAPEGR